MVENDTTPSWVVLCILLHISPVTEFQICSRGTYGALACTAELCNSMHNITVCTFFEVGPLPRKETRLYDGSPSKGWYHRVGLLMTAPHRRGGTMRRCTGHTGHMMICSFHTHSHPSQAFKSSKSSLSWGRLRRKSRKNETKLMTVMTSVMVTLHTKNTGKNAGNAGIPGENPGILVTSTRGQNRSIFSGIFLNFFPYAVVTHAATEPRVKNTARGPLCPMLTLPSIGQYCLKEQQVTCFWFPFFISCRLSSPSPPAREKFFCLLEPRVRKTTTAQGCPREHPLANCTLCASSELIPGLCKCNLTYSPCLARFGIACVAAPPNLTTHTPHDLFTFIFFNLPFPLSRNNLGDMCTMWGFCGVGIRLSHLIIKFFYIKNLEMCTDWGHFHLLPCPPVSAVQYHNPQLQKIFGIAEDS